MDDIFSVASTDLSPADWMVLSQRINLYLNEMKYDGVVITHGTNTLEETAYFLHLTCGSEKPIVLTAGADGELIRASCAAGAQGLVVTGTGAGLVSTAELEALEEARAAGVLVVRSNRLGNGRVVPVAKYETNGFISADNLTPQKARILLMLALTQTRDIAEIQQFFQEY